MKICSVCGWEYGDDFNGRCTICGAELLPAASVKYRPGQEPEEVQGYLRKLLEELNSTYPTHRINKADWRHDRWDKPLSALQNYLGYNSMADMLQAYGYTVEGVRTHSERQYYTDDLPSYAGANGNGTYTQNYSGYSQSKRTEYVPSGARQPVRPENGAGSAPSAYGLLQSLSERVMINGIIWLVIAGLQIIVGIVCLCGERFGMWPLLVAGVWNIFNGVRDLRYSKTVLSEPYDIVGRYIPLAMPIVILVWNVLAGGVVGVAGSIYYLVGIRSFVMDNRQYFDSLRQPPETDTFDRQDGTREPAPAHRPRRKPLSIKQQVRLVVIILVCCAVLTGVFIACIAIFDRPSRSASQNAGTTASAQIENLPVGDTLTRVSDCDTGMTFCITLDEYCENFNTVFNGLYEAVLGAEDISTQWEIVETDTETNSGKQFTSYTTVNFPFPDIMISVEVIDGYVESAECIIGDVYTAEDDMIELWKVCGYVTYAACTGISMEQNGEIWEYISDGLNATGLNTVLIWDNVLYEMMSLGDGTLAYQVNAAGDEFIEKLNESDAVNVVFWNGTSSVSSGTTAQSDTADVIQEDISESLDPVYPDVETRAEIESKTLDVYPDDSDYVEEATEGTVSTGGSNMRLRKGPGADYDVIKEVSDGTDVDIYAEKHDWYLIEAGGNWGWADSDYILLSGMEADSRNDEQNDEHDDERIDDEGLTLPQSYIDDMDLYFRGELEDTFDGADWSNDYLDSMELLGYYELISKDNGSSDNYVYLLYQVNAYNSVVDAWTTYYWFGCCSDVSVSASGAVSQSSRECFTNDAGEEYKIYIGDGYYYYGYGSAAKFEDDRIVPAEKDYNLSWNPYIW